MNSQTAVVNQKLNLLPVTKTKKKISKTSSKKKSLVVPRKTLLKIGISTLVLAILIGGVFGYTKAYADKIYPKMLVAGINVGGLTKKEARNKIEQKIQVLNENGPEITYNEQTLKPKLDEMGITFDTEKILEQAFDYGRDGNIPEKIKENYKLAVNGYRLEIKPQIDQAKFDNYLSQLASVVEKEAVNAQLSIHQGQITLSASEKGRGLDKTKLKDDLTELINSGQTAGKIVMQTSSLEPTINEDGTIDARIQAERYMAAAPITVTFETSSWSADRAEIGSWIKFTEDGNKLAVSAQPSAFINWVAQRVEIPAVDKEVQDGTGAVLSEGQDGRGVDTDTLTAQITDALRNGQSASFALLTFGIARSEKIIYLHAQPGRYAGRYIDINLSEQTLYAFEGSTLMNQFLISSGKSGYATPTGEYSVWGKTALQKMSGPDYYLPNVPWISWFNGEIAIHGTYWHSNFGTPMSHGCINASIPDAEWTYNFVEVDTPVYVHY